MKLKIGYFADGLWSHEAFNKLIIDNEIEIEFICVRYDTQDLVLKELSEKYGIDYLKYANINSKEFVDKVSTYDCDLFVSMSFNQIFKEEIINLPRLKTINCHAGMLPFYRGRNILNWALINDEKGFGITVHYMDEGIDTGDIILQRSFPITDIDDYSTLLNLSYSECANILYDSIVLFKSGIPLSKKQVDVHPVGFYCSQRKTGDEDLNWNQSSRDIFNFVRAICAPGPRARSFLNGFEMKINKIEYIHDAPTYKCKIGVILQKNKIGFLVKTSDSFVRVVDFEFEGKFKVGDQFEVK